MNYQEALKQVRAEKPKEGFVSFELNFGWREKLLLGHKDALALLEALSNAEVLQETSSRVQVASLNESNIKMFILPRKEYEYIKVAALLGVSCEEIRNMDNPTQQT